jgi:hypothetical protein
MQNKLFTENSISDDTVQRPQPEKESIINSNFSNAMKCSEQLEQIATKIDITQSTIAVHAQQITEDRKPTVQQERKTSQ